MAAVLDLGRNPACGAEPIEADYIFDWLRAQAVLARADTAQAPFSNANLRRLSR
jgi:hypothetical protein